MNIQLHSSDWALWLVLIMFSSFIVRYIMGRTELIEPGKISWEYRWLVIWCCSEEKLQYLECRVVQCDYLHTACLLSIMKAIGIRISVTDTTELIPLHLCRKKPQKLRLVSFYSPITFRRNKLCQKCRIAYSLYNMSDINQSLDK